MRVAPGLWKVARAPRAAALLSKAALQWVHGQPAVRFLRALKDAELFPPRASHQCVLSWGFVQTYLASQTCPLRERMSSYSHPGPFVKYL